MGFQPKYSDEPLMVEARNYWAGELQDLTFQMALGKGSSRPAKAGELCELAVSLDSGTRDLLKRKGQSELAVFSLVLSAIQAVLYGYAEEDRVVTAIPAFDHPETEADSNLLYIGSTIKDSSEFRQVVMHVKEKLELALQYQYYPAAALLEEQEQRMLSAVTLCSSSLHRHFEPAGHLRENPSSLVLDWRWEEHTAALHLFYISDYYDRAILNRMLKSVLSVLGDGLSDPSRQIGGIRIHPEEQAWLVKAASPGNAGHEQRTIFEQFEDAARVYRDHTAVIFDNMSVTYGELYDEAQNIAGGLRQQGIGKGSLVAVPAERSLQSITAILGVMASGAAFLPLDAGIPSQRFLYIVEECKPDMLITANPWYQEREELASAWTIGQETVGRWGLRLAAFNTKDEATERLEHLAYIIYTSGTTGKPKGVMITQEAFADRIIWRSEEYGLSETDCILQWFPLYFDGFLTSFFTPLITGAAIVQCGDAEARNPQAIVRLLQEHQVTHFICIPSMFIHLLEQAQGQLAHSLRIVTLAGERMTQSILDQCSQLHFELVNEYGPTECTVVATCLRSASSHMSIGKPVRNTDIYILGKDAKPVPAGVTGEICIGGIGVSPGYVNNEKLTQERFIPDPCHPGTRLYCTGDLGYWTEAGEIEYWGRRDRQVKMNGYRIELDEIERSLAGSSRVTNAAVVASGGPQGAGHRLIAYVEGDCKGKEQELQEFLKRLLPEYMIPERIIVLEQLPVTVQGKVDYRILESYPPEEKEHPTDSPLSPLQQTLADLYSAVLRLPRADPSSTFFEQGGNSITASVLLQQLQDQGFTAPAFREFYSNSTVFKLSALLESAEQTVLEPIPHLGLQEYYETSSIQKQMFLLENFMDVQTAYNMPGAVEITGALDVCRLQHALQKVTDENEILRTSFHLMEGLPVQKVHNAVNLDFIFEEDPYSELEGSFRQFIQPFRLNQPSQLRFKLIRRDEEHHWLFIDMHHMIGDAVTIERLLQQIMAAYGEGSGEPACAPLQYKDYAAWSNEQLRTGQYDNQLEYWKSLFDNEVPVLEYPCTDPLQPVFSNKGRRMQWHLEDRLFAQVSDYAAKSEVTLFMLLAAVYHLTLAKMTGQTDIVTGTPVSLRSKKDLQDVMGVFVNTLPLRSRPAYHKTVQEYLEEVRELSLQMYENMDVPLEDITTHVLREASPGHGVSRSLFQTVFAFQDYSLQPSAFGTLFLTPLSPDHAATKFDFMLEAYYTGSGLRFQLDYNPSRMDEHYAEELATRYRMLLEYIVKHSGDVLIQDLPNLLEEEYRQYVITYNETSKEYPLGLSVHQLFERQVQLTPERIALTHRGTHLTYKELNGQANQIAAFLGKQGIQPNELVGICADHSFALLIAILGVLKSGAAFLPIDPDQTQRAEYMLADSGARILLTDRADQFAAFAEQLKIVELSGAEYEQECTDNIPSLQRPDDLAYVIYTSGTSGQPKGTMIHHQGLTNYICWADEVYAGEEPVDFACYSSIAFDLTITSLFTPLIAGNRIWLYSGANKSLLIRDIIQDNQHCIVKLTPSHLKLIEEMDLSHTRIQKLIVGGEDLKNALAASIVRQSGGKIRIFNEYGPTETVVGCMIYEYVQGEEEGSVPIGLPAGNMQIYVLDAGLQPVPPRTAGEIYIAGVGVAKGYLHQEAMTQEKFIPNPFAPGKRMYKTGDLARRNASGELVYLGRADDQIKIRGHRIEPGEIEQALMQLPEVGQVVVVDGKHSNGERFLAAYYTSAQKELAAELHTHAKRNLPEYMVPRFFSRMERLPVTPNGKLDRSLLRNLPLQQEEPRAQPVFATETESLIASIWMEVLHTGSVGPQDNFFDAGGSSILAMKLFDRLDKQLPGEIEMTDIFAYPTIRLQAELLDKKAHAQIDTPVLAPSFELPEAYYTGRSLGWMEKTWTMKLSSKDWMEFHACCTRYGVTAGELLAGVYIYSLAAISGKTQIPLVLSTGRQVQLIELSMAGISDFPQLLGALNRELGVHTSQPGFQDTLFSESATRHIYPLIEMESEGLPAASPKRRYDLRLSFRQHPDSMTIELQYNAMKLSDRTADLFQGFAHYLGAVIHLE